MAIRTRQTIGMLAVSVAVTVAIAIGLGSNASGEESALQGTKCTRNSECQSPLVCRVDLGWCVVECRIDRDCAAGQHCTIGPYGQGSCAVNQVDKRTLCGTNKMTCVFAKDCASGRCANGLCQ